MQSRNAETYRAGHEAFNQRDFVAMTSQYAESISWTDHSQGRAFTTPREFRADFLAGWVTASADIKITGPRYIDAGQTVVCTFTVVGGDLYYDQVSLLMQLGLMPQPSAA